MQQEQQEKHEDMTMTYVVNKCDNNQQENSGCLTLRDMKIAEAKKKNVPYDQIVIIDKNNRNVVSASNPSMKVEQCLVVFIQEFYNELKGTLKQLNQEVITRGNRNFELQNQLRDAQESIGKLKVEYEVAREFHEQENQQNLATIKQQDAELKQKQNEIKNLDQQKVDMQNKSEGEIAGLNVQVQHLNQTISQHQETIIAKEKDIGNLKQQMQEQQNQVQQYQQQVQYQMQIFYSQNYELQNQNQTLQTENQTLQTQISQKDKKLKTMNGELEEQKDAFEQLKNKQKQDNDASSEKLKQLSKQISALKDEIQQREDDLKRGKKKYENLERDFLQWKEQKTKSASEFETENKSLKDEIRDLKNQIESLTIEKNKIPGLLHDLKEQNEKCENLDRTLRNQIKDLENNLEKEKTALFQTKRQLNDEKSLRQTAEDTLKARELKISENTKEISRLNQELTTLQQEKTKLEQDLKNTSRTANDSGQATRDLKAKVENLKKEINTHLENEMNLKAKVSQLTSLLEGEKQKVGNLDGQLKAKDNSLERFSKAMEDLKQKTFEQGKKRDEELDQKDFKIQMLRARIDLKPIDNIKSLVSAIKAKCKDSIFQNFKEDASLSFDNKEFEIFQISYDNQKINEHVMRTKVANILPFIQKLPASKGKLTANRTVQSMEENELYKGFMAQSLDGALKDKLLIYRERKEKGAFPSLESLVEQSLPFVLIRALFEKYVSLLNKEGVKPPKDFKFPDLYALKNIEKNNFYFAELVQDGDFIKYYGGVSPLRNDSDAQFVNSFGKFVYKLFNDSLIVSYMQSVGTYFYDPVICSRDCYLGDLDMGGSEFENFQRKFDVADQSAFGNYFQKIEKHIQ